MLDSREWSWVAATYALASSACGPGRGAADCEPGALDVVEVRSADDVAALPRVEMIAELHVVESDLIGVELPEESREDLLRWVLNASLHWKEL